MDILSVEHAVVRRELESRIAEGHWPESGENIDPHHITNALRDLINDGHIRRAVEVTRGGGEIETLQPTDRTNRGDRIDRAAVRKRLLYARYLGWATGTKRHPTGIVGPAGEAATRSAMLASGAVIPEVPGAGPVSRILGVDLAGLLDSAGYTIPVHSDGTLGNPVVLLFEVKNIRNWIFPTAEEPFQLLSKAVLVQRAQPDAAILPILVGRKSHPTTFWMASQLGFMVIDMERQFVGAVDETALMEVRNELHFNDLAVGHGPSLRVQDRLRETVRKHCAEYARVWRRTALDAHLGPRILTIPHAPAQRHQLVNELRAMVIQRGWGAGW